MFFSIVELFLFCSTTDFDHPLSVSHTNMQFSSNLHLGGYHFEIDDSKVRWFHRDESDKTVFSMMTSPVTLPRVWMHYTVTYNAYQQVAKVNLVF